LSAKNFVNPMSGVSQTVVQRAISSGLYFPVEEWFKTNLAVLLPTLHEDIRHFVAGASAGTINGVLLNPAARVKVSPLSSVLHV
jgi:hypothetical protein